MTRQPPPKKQTQKQAKKQIRLNKWLADAGVCSRREADRWIVEGRVSVNQAVVTEMGIQIDPAHDKVFVDKRRVQMQARLYLAFHKPKGVVCSRSDERQRKTIYDFLDPTCQSVDPVGRLDRNSSGLMLLSNDGDFLHRVMHPGFHWEKVYKVSFNQRITKSMVSLWLKGVYLEPEAVSAKAESIEILANEGGVYEAKITLITGYNRQIRRMAEAAGLDVLSLKRLSVGPIKLGRLKMGEVRPLTSQEKRALEQGAG